MFENNYIVDSEGNKLSVIIPYSDFLEIMEKLDEIDDLKEYYLSKSEKSELVPIESAFEII